MLDTTVVPQETLYRVRKDNGSQSSKERHNIRTHYRQSPWSMLVSARQGLYVCFRYFSAPLHLFILFKVCTYFADTRLVTHTWTYVRQSLLFAHFDMCCVYKFRTRLLHRFVPVRATWCNCVKCPTRLFKSKQDDPSEGHI